MHFEAPGFYKKAFNCPHCNAYAAMAWDELKSSNRHLGCGSNANIHAATCACCNEISIWKGILWAAPVLLAPLSTQSGDNHFKGHTSDRVDSSIQLFPIVSAAPIPHPDIPNECLSDYLEARDIFARSPRGAAALLRLVVQKLCRCLGEKGKKIDHDIGSLVRQGLPKNLQEAFDTVRIVGNEAVHPSSMDIDSAPEVVMTLFRLVNHIVQKMISEPREQEEYSQLYASLPPDKLQWVHDRDKPKS